MNQNGKGVGYATSPYKKGKNTQPAGTNGIYAPEFIAFSQAEKFSLVLNLFWQQSRECLKSCAPFWILIVMGS